MDFFLDLLFSSATLGLIVGVVLAGVVCWLLPEGASCENLGASIVLICFVGGLLYEFASGKKGK
ncbi:hypothetical protein [Uliginosibacterium flavum]|uniref:TMhelix containing protein n=1 Tax=Uliginosibacterium flavum TaxID=1396831 RepID=A0ABV2TR40_9RHOO